MKQRTLLKHQSYLTIHSQLYLHILKKLERQLDVKLFYRKKYGMELTEEGLAYVKYAKVILDSNSEYERENKRTLQ